MLKFPLSRLLGLTKGVLGKVPWGRASTGAAHGAGQLGQHASTFLKMHLVTSGAMMAFGSGTPQERLREVGVTTLFMWSTLGMQSGWRQFMWGAGIMSLPHAGSLITGLSSAYRHGLEARSSAAVPFGHSNMNMDQAYATLAYARQQMGAAYGLLGSEASFMAARYTQRG